MDGSVADARNNLGLLVLMLRSDESLRWIRHESEATEPAMVVVAR